MLPVGVREVGRLRRSAIAASLPSPLPASPWHDAHCASYSFLPAAIDVGRCGDRILQLRLSVVLLLSGGGDRDQSAATVRPPPTWTTRAARAQRASNRRLLIASHQRCLQYNPGFWSVDGTTADRPARPAVVQFAKTFEMPRHNAVNDALFHRVFHRFCENRRGRAGN